MTKGADYKGVEGYAFSSQELAEMRESFTTILYVLTSLSEKILTYL